MKSLLHNSHTLLLSIFLLLISGCEPVREVESPPQVLDTGPGPVELLTLNVLENEVKQGEVIESSIFVTTDSAGFAEFVESPDLQLRIFLDDTQVEAIVFYSAGKAMLVSQEFELLVPELPINVLMESSTLEIIVPLGAKSLEALATLGWNTAPESLNATILPGLNYFGLEIGRVHYGINGLMTEIFFDLTTTKEFRKAHVKKWHANIKLVRSYLKTEADTTNPRGNLGPMYKHFPLEFKDNVMFFEYWHKTGFVKRFLIDSNGNGKRDSTEVDGFVGRCSFTPGYNKQTMWKNGSTTWTTEFDNLNVAGKRIRHVLKKRRKADGTEEWVVESTHEEQKKGNKGKWTKSKPGKGKTNPIVSPPYEKPGDVPGSDSFGLQ